MAQKTNNLSQEHQLLPAMAKAVKKHHRLVIILVIASVLALGIVLGAIGWFYHDRALPNVSLGSIDVGGKTKEEIKQIALQQKNAIAITFVRDGQTVPASLDDVGINIDIDASVDRATWARRNWLDLVLAWEHHTIPLVYTSDLGKAKAFAKENFPDIVTDAKDAQLVFDTTSNSYRIEPGAPGQGFDAVAFMKAIEGLATKPQPIALPLTTSPVQPIVRTDELGPVKEHADKVKDLQLKFLYEGAVKYTADPVDIAGWTHFIPDTETGRVNTSYDEAAIMQFLRDKVGPTIAAKAQDKKIVRDSNTGREIVIQSGHEGREIADMEGISKDVMAALENLQPLEKQVTVTTSAFKTVTLSGTDRWIEVDLSEQRTTLYLGAEAVATFSISSGIWKHPTVTGEFAIRYKTANQVMSGGSKATGDYYYLPNVTWVSYFYEDYAFHTAYWHNNFGHPMSHGCINMRAADAKTLYDFAPIGTRVIVHA